MAGMVITAAGRAAVAAAMANNTPITVSHIAFGTADRHPTGGETALTQEVVRKAVLNHGVDGMKAYFDARLEADEGPWVIYEVGLFSAQGTLLFIGRIDGFNKLVMEDQPLTLDYRAYVLASDFRNVVVEIDTAFSFAAAERTITATEGVKGGGDLTQDRVFRLGFENTAPITGSAVAVATDRLAIRDESEDVHKSITTNELENALARSSPRLAGKRWQIKTAAYTAKHGDMIACDVRNGGFVISPPSSPVAGDTFTVATIWGDATTAGVTIGGPVQGDTSLLIDVNYATVPVAWDGAEWRIC